MGRYAWNGLMLLFFIIVMAPNGGPRVYAGEPLKLVFIDTGYEPFIWTDTDGKNRGILIDIFDEILINRMGRVYVFEGLPWVRAQRYVEDGERDGFVAPPTPARRAYTCASAQPVIIGRVGLFTFSRHPGIEQMKAVKRIADLQRFKLVDYIGNSWSEQRLKGVKDIYWAPNIDNALKILARSYHSRDILVNQRLVILAKLKKMGLTGQVIEVPGVVLGEAMFHLCIGKKSTHLDLLPRFNKVFREIQDDGIYQKILARYE